MTACRRLIMGHKVGMARRGSGGFAEQQERVKQEGQVLKYQYFKWEQNIHQLNQHFS